jgi:archaemetzincin
MLTRRALLVTAACAALAPRVRAQTRLRVEVQPYTPAPSEREIKLVEDSIRALFAVDVVRRDPLPLPPDAYTAGRKRWRAELLLTHLAATPGDAHKVVGLTAADISTTKGAVLDWGILGLGDIGGRACVLSSFRTKKGARNAEHARERLAKVVVHELGHTFGSDHCPTRGCLMEDALGTVRTLDHERDFCDTTRAFFASRKVPLVTTPTLPWPRVK